MNLSYVIISFADIDQTRKVIDLFNWEKVFSDFNLMKNVNVFNKITLNIQTENIAHETILVDGKGLPWQIVR